MKLIHRYLPRLNRAWYQGRTAVLWTHCLENRTTGWLNQPWHRQFCLELVHILVRYDLVCPGYVLMPDHLHMLLLGMHPGTDQVLAARKLRHRINLLLHPLRLQKQGHDHVLRGQGSDRDALYKTWYYVCQNPVRAGLVEDWRKYPYLGALIPGYPHPDPRRKDFWETFWKLYAMVLHKSNG